MDAEAVTNAVGHDSGSAVREAYVRWVEKVDSQLADLIHDSSVTEMLQSERYWHIRAIHGPAMRPWPLGRPSEISRWPLWFGWLMI